ncbi:MAG: respiratory nitrate reductase subunit gamma [Polyangiaceae bacterium UTPRO1]|jgi:nitrate reductase gamma subunit|nr:respiratory nitrate reductase subunit gamma [Myxococcales bacterium]OQY65752.1 MAG: respiratory nitrate reductase subunit gamma [Polyangiaceae bacterium UTPRO1]
MSTVDLFNAFLFIAYPYIAGFVFLLGTIYRYRETGFKVSSLSSQFLEGDALFWGIVPFHIGLLVLFFGHLSAFLFPQLTLAWNAEPLRLIILESTGFIFAVSTLFSLIFLLYRRLTNPRIRAVTTTMDYVIELLLLVQVFFGCWVAVAFRWGSSWFAADLTPYLWSLLTFTPDTTAVYALPWQIKVHIVGAFTILLMVPFTRLIHFLVAPLHYIFRPYQQVMWNWDRKGIRDPRTAWSAARPKNN